MVVVLRASGFRDFVALLTGLNVLCVRVPPPPSVCVWGGGVRQMQASISAGVRVCILLLLSLETVLCVETS